MKIIQMILASESEVGAHLGQVEVEVILGHVVAKIDLKKRRKRVGLPHPKLALALVT